MHLIEGISDNLNYKNNNYYGMCIAMQMLIVDVTESIRSYDAVDDRY
jgi:hypothetical protein